MKQLKLKIAGSDSFAFTEAFKYLRTNLQFCGADVKAIGITSCLENEGKSLVSMNVAKAFAEMGKRTLLLDADMRKSVVVGRYTNEKDTKGLSEILSGQVQMNDALYAAGLQTVIDAKQEQLNAWLEANGGPTQTPQANLDVINSVK